MLPLRRPQVRHLEVLVLSCVLLVAAAHSNSGTPSLPRTARQATCVSSMFKETVSQTAGPYYFDGPLRQDITEGRAGAKLALTVAVKDKECATFPAGVRVAVWHADAAGVYSGYQTYPDASGRVVDTRGEVFLRGEQLTDARGRVTFYTIVPGWYSSRPVHIHVKVFYGSGKVLTSQLYFKEELLAVVERHKAYAARGAPDTANADEGVPESLILDVKSSGDGAHEVTYEVGIDTVASSVKGTRADGTAGTRPKTGDGGSSGSSGKCFPADACVRVEGGGVRRMSALAVGDRVLVGGGVYSDVFAFTHRVAGVVSEFVTLTVESGERVSLTPGHYIYANGALVDAGAVRVGDELVREGGGCSVVVAVGRELKAGLYNPQTLHGDICVDGLVASTYTTAVEPSVAHRMLAPLRFGYWLTGGSDVTFGAVEGGSASGARLMSTIGLTGSAVEDAVPSVVPLR
jgi:protocatechuate 3,4-dioxygenase beta subunit